MLRYFIAQFAVLFFALAASGRVMHRLTQFYKVIVLNLLIAFVALIGGVVLQMLAPGSNNQWLFNTYIVTEAAVLLYAGSLFFTSWRAKAMIIVAFALFMMTWLLQVRAAGFGTFAHKAYMLECIIIVLLYLLVLYRHLMHIDTPVYTAPVFWICCGLVLFFGCNIPYIGFVHLLQQKNAGLNEALYNRIIVTLQNLRYLFAGIGLLLYRKHHTAQQPGP
jgi:hypothetical protein